MVRLLGRELSSLLFVSFIGSFFLLILYIIYMLFKFLILILNVLTLSNNNTIVLLELRPLLAFQKTNIGNTWSVSKQKGGKKHLAAFINRCFR